MMQKHDLMVFNREYIAMNHAKLKISIKDLMKNRSNKRTNDKAPALVS